MQEFNYIECGCMTPQHTIRYWVDKDAKVLWAEPYASRAPFWRRFKAAIRFVRTGDASLVQEWAWNKESLPGLQKAVQQLEVWHGK